MHRRTWSTIAIAPLVVARLVNAPLVLAPLVLLAASVAAQSATFAGGVVRDTLGHGIPGAQVLLPDLNRSDTTDSRGEFKFSGLPAGRVIVAVRRVGFIAMADTVTLINGRSIEREYVMDAQAVSLNSVQVMASVAPTTRSIRMEEFEAHRKLGYGHFILDAELRRSESRKLEDIIASSTPGLRVFRPSPVARPTAEYLASARSSCNGPAFSCGGGTPCAVTLYVDGMMYYNPAVVRASTATPASTAGHNPAGSETGDADVMMADFPDLSRFSVRDYAAVEFYPGGGSIPEKYNATTNSCGVLLLWTRDR